MRGRGRAAYKVVTEEQHALVLSGNGKHEDCPECWQGADSRNDQAFPLESSGKPARPDDYKDLDDAERDVEENCLKVGVAEVPDNEAAES